MARLIAPRALDKGILLAITLTWTLSACGTGASRGAAGGTGAGTAGSPACDGKPSLPLLLGSIGSFGQFDQVTAITATGPYVYYAVENGSDEPVALFQAPIAGGPATPIIPGGQGCAASPFGDGVIASDGRYLFTPSSINVPPCADASTGITAYDLATGTTSSLPNPPTPVTRLVGQVRAAPGGGALWTYVDTSPGGTTWIVRWDGTSTSVLLDIPDEGIDFTVAGDRVLMETLSSLYLASLTGAPAPTPVGTIDFGTFAFVGANATAFFYSEDGTSIERRDAASGAVTTIATGANTAGGGPDSLWADDDWVYFRIGGSATNGPPQLGRVPTTGGPVETIYAEPTRNGLQVVTSDRCNVYWVAGPSFDASQPAALFVRAK